MIRERLRKLLRRLILWALADQEPNTLINWDIKTGRSRFNVESFFVSGASSPEGRKVIVDTLQKAQRNREL